MASTQRTPVKLAGLKIKKTGTNPAREGSKRHAIFSAILKARTVETAYATAVRVGRKTVYPSSRNLRYLESQNVIQLV